MNPHRIHFRISTLSPVMLAAGPPAHNLLTTLEYIPDNTVRSLLAARYLEQGSSDDPQFREIGCD